MPTLFPPKLFIQLSIASFELGASVMNDAMATNISIHDCFYHLLMISLLFKKIFKLGAFHYDLMKQPGDWESLRIRIHLVMRCVLRQTMPDALIEDIDGLKREPRDVQFFSQINSPGEEHVGDDALRIELANHLLQRFLEQIGYTIVNLASYLCRSSRGMIFNSLR